MRASAERAWLPRTSSAIDFVDHAVGLDQGRDIVRRDAAGKGDLREGMAIDRLAHAVLEVAGGRHAGVSALEPKVSSAMSRRMTVRAELVSITASTW